MQRNISYITSRLLETYFFLCLTVSSYIELEVANLCSISPLVSTTMPQNSFSRPQKNQQQVDVFMHPAPVPIRPDSVMRPTPNFSQRNHSSLEATIGSQKILPDSPISGICYCKRCIRSSAFHLVGVNHEELSRSVEHCKRTLAGVRHDGKLKRKKNRRLWANSPEGVYARLHGTHEQVRRPGNKRNRCALCSTGVIVQGVTTKKRLKTGKMSIFDCRQCRVTLCVRPHFPGGDICFDKWHQLHTLPNWIPHSSIRKEFFGSIYQFHKIYVYRNSCSLRRSSKWLSILRHTSTLVLLHISWVTLADF